MFNSVLAVDIDSYIVDFKDRVSALSLAKPILLDNAELKELPKKAIEAVDALMVSIYKDINEEFLRALPSLRYVGVLGTSTKKLDTAYCKKNGIQVSVVKEYCDDDTAEWVILQILKFFRSRSEPESAFHKCLGIIGFGSVGKKLAHKADGLGMRVFINTLSAEVGKYEEASKEHIFAHCDVVSFHTPSHSPWLLKEQLKHTKKNGLLINTCFGAIDKDHALKDFLSERPDVTLVLDQVAKVSYEDLPPSVIVGKDWAYQTKDATMRLIERFFEQAQKACKE